MSEDRPEQAWGGIAGIAGGLTRRRGQLWRGGQGVSRTKCGGSVKVSLRFGFLFAVCGLLVGGLFAFPNLFQIQGLHFVPGAKVKGR